MSRRGAGKPPGIQLFPFLAVLIATMGVLVVLLQVFARHGRIEALEAAEKRAAEQSAEDPDMDLELLELRVAQLQESRTKTESQLTEKRLELSHLEDHLRQLQDQLQKLIASVQQMHAMQTASVQEQQNAQRELEELRARTAQAEKDLVEAQRQLRDRPPSYSVVPYDGRNKTRRRPIYIECLADAVLLQPEGIILRPADFAEPLGPGNPLASAIRAHREYHLAQQVRSGNSAENEAQQDEPYPLLLVRPEGIEAYYKAREAISSWGSEFGYELIGDDWKLSFPPADPQLAEITQKTVEDARVRQRLLARSAPRSYGKERPVFRAHPVRGGLIQEGGTAREPGSGRGFSGDGNSTAKGSGWSGSSGDQSEAAVTGKTQDAATDPGDAGDGTKPSTAKQTARNARADKSSLAKTRGTDWGLPDARLNSVAVTRPLYIECRGDRLIIPPEDRRGGKEIMLQANTEDSVDEFVAAVWEHTKTWGTAGKGLYWRPILVIRVTPDGAGRFEELHTLLADSGLGVERRQSAPTATMPPRTTRQ